MRRGTASGEVGRGGLAVAGRLVAESGVVADGDRMRHSAARLGVHGAGG